MCDVGTAITTRQLASLGVLRRVIPVAQLLLGRELHDDQALPGWPSALYRVRQPAAYDVAPAIDIRLIRFCCCGAF